jgi:hypothetical protein
VSFLTPLYILGLAAISLPILFHLIRRTPRGRKAFSSLMFLSASPPRLTRRSRLDNLLLLLLRALAIGLLALGFSRPFFREAVNLTLDDARSRRVAIVLDTSASMQRGELWERAKSKVRDVLTALEPGDEVAFFTFHDLVETKIDFSSTPGESRADQAELVRHAVSQTAPSWGGTNVGLAIVTASDALGVANDLQQSDAAMQIVLISDMQKGARLDALQAYEWPRNVSLSVERVAPANRSNATLRVLANDEEAVSSELRVKVTNSSASSVDQFYLGWSSADDNQDALALYVPPGQSRVVRVARDERNADSGKMVLRGDDTPFDNTFHTVPLEKERLTVAYLGDDEADDPEGLRYYLELAMADTFQREIEFVGPEDGSPFAKFGGAPGQPADMIVLAQLVPQELLVQLKRYVEHGGCLLSVIKEREAAVQLVTFVDDIQVGDREEKSRDEYVMLGEINFSHPLFSAFAKPQYNDFTKIHFWNHIRMEMPDNDSTQVVARFDDGSPAIWEKRLGDGKLVVMTSGWNPLDSQLALSTKFVPLVTGILDQASGTTDVLPSYAVYDRVAVPHSGDSDVTVTKPDGEQVKLSGEQADFKQTDQPGIYHVRFADRQQSFAVNLAASECDTSLLDNERLEELGVQLGRQATQSEELDRQRQLRDVELEGRQNVWRWLIVAAMGVLLIETWLAGRHSRAGG